MVFRIAFFTAAALFALAFAGCESPYKKADEKDKQPHKNAAEDQTFQAFVGRLRIAVAKKDLPMLSSMMTADFGYRWDTPPAGENVFSYWDQHNVWPEISRVLGEQFGPSDLYVVAPAQAATDPNYTGYRAGMRVVNGGWKFAYFVQGGG